jgi:beta-galactosidase
MISRYVGKGSISYLGTLPAEALMRELLVRAVKDADVSVDADDLPKDVELCNRSTARHHVAILINHSTVPAEAKLHGSYRSLFPETTLTRDGDMTKVDLPSQGVAVLELDQEAVQ